MPSTPPQIKRSPRDIEGPSFPTHRGGGICRAVGRLMCLYSLQSSRESLFEHRFGGLWTGAVGGGGGGGLTGPPTYPGQSSAPQEGPGGSPLALAALPSRPALAPSSGSPPPRDHVGILNRVCRHCQLLTLLNERIQSCATYDCGIKSCRVECVWRGGHMPAGPGPAPVQPVDLRRPHCHPRAGPGRRFLPSASHQMIHRRTFAFRQQIGPSPLPLESVGRTNVAFTSVPTFKKPFPSNTTPAS